MSRPAPAPAHRAAGATNGPTTRVILRRRIGAEVCGWLWLGTVITCGRYRAISDENHKPTQGAEELAELRLGLRTSLERVRLNHLHLHVSDVARARTFYERWFGFEKQVQHGSILFLRDQGGLDLALAPDPNAGPMPPWFHFGFGLDSIQEVEALHAAMVASGVDIRQPFENWGDLAAFRCADDDGYQIEVYWE